MMFFFNLRIALRKHNLLPSTVCMLPHNKPSLADLMSSGRLFPVAAQISASLQGSCFPPLINSSCQSAAKTDLPTPPKLLQEESGSSGLSADLDPFPSPEQSWKLCSPQHLIHA